MRAEQEDQASKMWSSAGRRYVGKTQASREGQVSLLLRGDDVTLVTKDNSIVHCKHVWHGLSVAGRGLLVKWRCIV